MLPMIYDKTLVVLERTREPDDRAAVVRKALLDGDLFQFLDDAFLKIEA